MAIWDSIKKYGGYALGGVPGALLNPEHRKRILGIADESDSAQRQRAMLEEQGGKAGAFADTGEAGFGALGAEGAAARDMLRRQASGELSLSGEQLRQALQQQVAAQRSAAASAAPANAAMAARTAAIQGGRAASATAGQAAMAGIAERQAAQRALAEMIAQMRQQELQAALGGRQTAIAGFGGVKPEASDLEKWLPVIQAGAGAAQLAAKSDERAKRDIKPGNNAANDAIEGLRAFTFRYKNERDGKGEQLGVMAQDLEKAGLKHAVMDTPDGKMVHGAKLATANTAMIKALADRVAAIEGKGRR